jgi:imidazolonepropionase-like amidohydrolase
MLISGAAYLDPAGRRVTGHGLLLEEGTIRRIAKAAEFDGFAGERMDAAGCTVLPGLVDCHVHFTLGGEANPLVPLQEMSHAQLTLRALHLAQATLRGGVTAARDCGGKDYVEIAVRDAILRGMFPGPIIRAVGKLICMTGGHGHFVGRVADGPQDVVRAVREQIKAGCDQIKLMATGGVMTPGVNPEDAHFTGEEIGAGIREAQRFGRKTASHAMGSAGILNAVRGGIDSVEHGIWLNDECVQEMIRRGTYLVPTLSALNNILRNAGSVPAYVLEKSQRVAEHHRQSVLRFHRAGGRIAMGTDAGTPYNLHGENAMELEYMAQLGIPPLDAILAATRNAAELLSLPTHGAIAEGKAADLLIVRGDPLQDITAVSRKANHRAVLKGGVVA